MKCACHSGKPYEECCSPYHKGDKLPETALKLMRSRYSAYARGLADYVISTTHPMSPSYEKNLKKWKKSIEHFSSTVSFIGLAIESSEGNDTHATVTFHAHLLESGKDVSFREKSVFEKVNGKWLYKSGDIG